MRCYDVFIGDSLATRGLRASLITRVTDNAHGRFVIDYLVRCGVDTSQVQYDKNGRKTSLAFAESGVGMLQLVYRESVLLILHLMRMNYRRNTYNCRRCFFISNTALVQDSSRSAVHAAVEIARNGDVCIDMDRDYRPYGWSCKQETRDVLSAIAKKSHILIGTRGEFEVLGFYTSLSDEECAQYFLDENAKSMVIKHSKDSANVFTHKSTNYRGVALSARLWRAIFVCRR